MMNIYERSIDKVKVEVKDIIQIINPINEELSKVMNENKELHNHILFKEGFIIKHHKIRLNSSTIRELKELTVHIEKIIEKENFFKNKLDNMIPYMKTIKELAHIISKSTKVNYHSFSIGEIKYYLNNALRNSKLAIIQINELEKYFYKNGNPNFVELGDNKFLISVEKMLNQLKHFIILVQTLDKDFRNFRQTLALEEYRTYGRAMNNREYKATVSTGQLSSKKDPTPVFDAPSKVIQRINSMSKDERKNFFSTIGVENAKKVLYFRTNIKPINDTPIHQSNGLREYKFPKNLAIEIINTAA